MIAYIHDHKVQYNTCFCARVDGEGKFDWGDQVLNGDFLLVFFQYAFDGI